MTDDEGVECLAFKCLANERVAFEPWIATDSADKH
jgi:hypothetical protein